MMKIADIHGNDKACYLIFFTAGRSLRASCVFLEKWKSNIRSNTIDTNKSSAGGTIDSTIKL